jgi:hypothetical protein
MAKVTEPIMTCPYTGLRFLLEFHHNKAGSYWQARGLYDPCQTFATEAEATIAICTRNGAARIYKALRCPYTGRPVSILQNPRSKQWHLAGAWSPTRLFPSRQAAEYALSTRNGRKPDLPTAPPNVQVIGIVEAPPLNPVSDLGGDAGDLVEERVENMVEALGCEK